MFTFFIKILITKNFYKDLVTLYNFYIFQKYYYLEISKLNVNYKKILKIFLYWILNIRKNNVAMKCLLK